MSDAYAIVDIPKSLPLRGMDLTSTVRKIEHNKVEIDTQTYESNGSVSLEKSGSSSKSRDSLVFEVQLSCFTWGTSPYLILLQC